ncbi:hypothetical protein G6F32_013824 [Rhizopus arrhizus]|nr:hypothetical protein G6F32_013824 [Rhizopus arrhizus]
MPPSCAAARMGSARACRCVRPHLGHTPDRTPLWRGRAGHLAVAPCGLRRPDGRLRLCPARYPPVRARPARRERGGRTCRCAAGTHRAGVAGGVEPGEAGKRHTPGAGPALSAAGVDCPPGCNGRGSGAVLRRCGGGTACLRPPAAWRHSAPLHAAAGDAAAGALAIGCPGALRPVAARPKWLPPPLPGRGKGAGPAGDGRARGRPVAVAAAQSRRQCTATACAGRRLRRAHARAGAGAAGACGNLIGVGRDAYRWLV